ncbi:MAG: hybrid sensor histidine kinase/response regulator [Bacteroidales bacterium]|nr:hybrid sensor histidine kinase/response regulator [Bacteroidales bacterium]
MSKQVILCVDDEVIVLDALKEQIQQGMQDEYLVEVAEGAEEALEIFNELIEEGLEVPLIIADFIMPGMKGDALLQKFHEYNASSKKILLTGQASIEGIGNAINKADLYRFISKPWEKEDLILTLKEALKSYDQEKTIFSQNEELRELNANLEKKVDQRTRELKELNATKDKFFSIIAHDLKNPFNTLMGFTELLLGNLDDYSTEKIHEFIGILHETSRTSYALLENLLEWSRSQTGNLLLEPETISLSMLVKENILLLNNNAARKGVQLINNVPEGTFAYADINMTKTVIRNLISNAIKYTEEEGSISCTATKSGDMIEVGISDTGIGIKPENLQKLFRIDVNFSTRGTADEGGTGLGLILCREFILKNGGDIWAESELGKGSTFKFTLPVSS